jgi:hypothetical protein
MITLDGVMQAPVGPRKMNRAVSNMAVGRHLMVTKFMVGGAKRVETC